MTAGHVVYFVLMQASSFDVFLSYHNADSSVVEQVAQRLQGKGITPWLDLWCLAGGDNWQEEIICGLRASKACAVCIGPHGLGDWAREELAVAQSQATKSRDFRLFMVLLPGAPKPNDPSLAFLATRTWVDLRAGIDDPTAFRKFVRAITGAPRHGPARGQATDEASPYRGLEVFDEAHAKFFFGRDDDIRRAVAKLADSRFLAVLGPSGSGKSSLVRAGVIPALKGDALAKSKAWDVHLVKPGARPLSVLAAQVARLLPQDSTLDILDRMRADERSLDEAASLALTDQGAGRQLLLVVDQFEELFTLCADDAERAAFVANLCYAGTIPGGCVVVLVAMRADFYHRCVVYPQLRALMAGQQFLVGPLDRDGLRQVIEQPAWRVGLELEAGLAETVLDDVADQPGGLPLLEHVLLEVWRRRQGTTLTLEAYAASGRVAGALAQRADAIYEGLPPAQQRIVRRVLLRLIQPGEGTEDTRRRATMGELLSHAEEVADLDAVVKALADSRLLITGSDEVTGAPVVDVAHEALIRGWPRLRSWIDDARETLRAHRRLTEAARDWDENKREDEFLWHGTRLATWQDRPTDDLNDLERAFLAASRAREARKESTKRRRMFVAVTSLIVIIFLALVQVYRVTVERDRKFSRQLASRVREQLARDPQLGLLLAKQAFEASPTSEAASALRQATLDAGKRGILRGHQGTVWSVAFSPNGQHIASVDDAGTVRVWDLNGRADPIVLRGHNGQVYGVAFSPDGQQVTSAGNDSTVRIWDLTGRAPAVVLRGHNGLGALDAVFSPEGQRVVSAGTDGTVWIWDLAGRANPVVLTGHDGAVASVAFRADGKQIASAGSDGTVRVWDLTGSVDPVVLAGHNGRVDGVAFSPDGKQIASAGGDGTVRVWDLTGSVDPVVLVGHYGEVADVAFSRDGQRIASADGHDGTVRVWDLTSTPDPLVLIGHTAIVRHAEFSPDGRRIASAGGDGDGTVRVWDLSSRADPIVLAGHKHTVFDSVFSPDGQRVVSAGGDGTVRVWDLSSRADPSVLTGHDGVVYGVAFSLDRQRVVSAGGDGTVRIWNLAGNADPLVLTGHDGIVRTVAFSPDGQRVASAGLDGTIRVWDLASSADPLVLTDHNGPVYSAAFSADGQRIVSAGNDRTVRVWDLASSDDSVVLGSHTSRPYDAVFSPDGQRVVTAGEDGTVQVWNCEVCGSIEKVAVLAEQRVTRELTPKERRAFLRERA